jgi:hypothetical protein
VRASGRTRKHLRDCSGCSEYRNQLRGVRAGLSALAPGPGPLAAALKLLGIGGAAGGGAASSGAAAGGGAIVVAGGGTAAKVTAVVCCAALAAGGDAEVTHKIIEPSRGSSGATASPKPAALSGGPISGHRLGSSAAAAAAGAAGAVGTATAKAKRDVAAAVDSTAAQIAHNTTSPTRASESSRTSATGVDHADEVTGGSAAPDEENGFGHGVDGLTPRTEVPAGGSGAALQQSASGGATAPVDTIAPAATPANPSTGSAAAAGTAPGSFK